MIIHISFCIKRGKHKTTPAVHLSAAVAAGLYQSARCEIFRNTPRALDLIRHPIRCLGARGSGSQGSQIRLGLGGAKVQ